MKKHSNYQKNSKYLYLTFILALSVFIFLGCSKTKAKEYIPLSYEDLYETFYPICETEKSHEVNLPITKLENELENLKIIEKLKDKTLEVLQKGDIKGFKKLLGSSNMGSDKKIKNLVNMLSKEFENKKIVLREQNYFCRDSSNGKKVSSLYNEMFQRTIYGSDEYWYEYDFDLISDKDVLNLQLSYSNDGEKWFLSNSYNKYSKLGGKTFLDWFKDYEILRKQDKILPAYIRFKMASDVIPLYEKINYELGKSYKLDSKWYLKQKYTIDFEKYKPIKGSRFYIKPDYWIEEQNFGYAIIYNTANDLDDKKAIKEEAASIHELLMKDGILDKVGHYVYIPKKQEIFMEYEPYDNKVVFINEGITGLEPIDQFVESRDTHLIKDVELEKIIKESLKMDQGDLTKEQLATIEELDTKEASIFDLSGLEYLVNLKKLNLSNLIIADLTPISNLKYLTDLDVSKNELENTANVFSSSNLKTLNLEETKIENSKDIILGLNIENLNISKSSISFKKLFPLKNLISLSAKKITDFYSIEMRKFPKLKKLNLNNSNLNSVKFVTFLTNLEELEVANNNILSIEDLGLLTKLKKFNIANNDIKSIESLSNLKKLEDLNIKNTNVENLNCLSKVVSLKNLNISSLKIQSLDFLKYLKSLEKLNIYGNHIKNINVLSNLTELKEIYLGSTEIESLEPLKNSNKLEIISIFSTRINSLSSLSKLTKLKEIVLSLTLVESLEPIRNLTQIKSLDLRGTKIKSLEPLNNFEQLENLQLNFDNFEDLSILKKVRKRGSKIK